jgi:hypothetical protein
MIPGLTGCEHVTVCAGMGARLVGTTPMGGAPLVAVAVGSVARGNAVAVTGAVDLLTGTPSVM